MALYWLPSPVNKSCSLQMQIMAPRHNQRGAVPALLSQGFQIKKDVLVGEGVQGCSGASTGYAGVHFPSQIPHTSSLAVA